MCNLYKSIAAYNIIPVSFRMRQCERFSLPQARSTVWRLGVSSAPEKPRWVLVGLPTVCYELKDITAEIICIRGNSDITILPNVNTLQCIVTVVRAKCKVSFDVPNFLPIVLGFIRNIDGGGCHASENLVNIMSVNSILVHWNLLHSSYMRGTQALVA